MARGGRAVAVPQKRVRKSELGVRTANGDRFLSGGQSAQDAADRFA
jgi:hypothetical protein